MTNTKDAEREAVKLEENDDMVRRMGRVGAFAPGDYMCKCVGCGVMFSGDKRAVNCLPCAVDSLTRPHSPTKGAEPALWPTIMENRRSWPPEPLMYPNAEWCESYAKWHSRHGPSRLAAAPQAPTAGSWVPSVDELTRLPVRDMSCPDDESFYYPMTEDIASAVREMLSKRAAPTAGGPHEPGCMIRLEGECKRCNHQWKVRGAIQITDAVTEDAALDHTRGG